MKKKPLVVELAEYDAVVRELADQYYIVRQWSAELAQKLGAKLEAFGIDKHDARPIIDEEMRKILEEFAINLRLPPKAELGGELGELEEGVEYRINNDMSWLRKAAAEALRPTPEDNEILNEESGEQIN